MSPCCWLSFILPSMCPIISNSSTMTLDTTFRGGSPHVDLQFQGTLTCLVLYIDQECPWLWLFPQRSVPLVLQDQLFEDLILSDLPGLLAVSSPFIHGHALDFMIFSKGCNILSESTLDIISDHFPSLDIISDHFSSHNYTLPQTIT